MTRTARSRAMGHEAAVSSTSNLHRPRADPLSSRSPALWAGVLVPPAAWAAHLVLGDLIFELGCSPGIPRPHVLGLSLAAWALIETGVLATATILAGLGSLAAWRRLTRAEVPRDPPALATSWGRAHALALAGMASSALYLLIIGFGFFPTFVLRTCGTSL